jgi:hypothetical protein
MSLLEGQVGPARHADGEVKKTRLGNSGEIITGGLNGSFYEQVARGNGYAFTTALAGNALVVAGTGNAPAIWNPPSSGRLLSIVKVVFARTAKGLPLEGSIVYLRLQHVHSRKGTAADLVSGTSAAAVNLRSDLGDNSYMVFFPTTIVTTATPDIWACSGIGQTADNGATTVSGPRAEQLTDHINGLLVVGPGTLFSLGAALAPSSTYTITIFGLSLLLPLHAT